MRSPRMAPAERNETDENDTREENGTATFVGFERFVGRIGSRSGSFVVETIGTFDGNEARTAWSVVAGSGTDDLQGLRGEGTAVAPHGPNGSFSLDYDFDG